MVKSAEATGTTNPGFASQRASTPPLSHAKSRHVHPPQLDFFHVAFLVAPPLERVLTLPHDRLNLHQTKSLSYLASLLAFAWFSVFVSRSSNPYSSLED
jgi:hypothetical protein